MRKLSFYFLVFTLVLVLCACSNQSKEEQVTEGKRLQQAGNFQGAIVLFKNALESDPNYFPARYELGNAYLETGHYDKAEKAFLKVSVQSPGHEKVNVMLAKAYLATDRLDDAEKAANKQLAKSPEQVEAITLLGTINAKRDNLEAAQRFFSRALEIDASSTTAKIGLASVYLRSGGDRQATKLLNEVIEQDPTSKIAYHILASLERRNGNNKESHDLYNRLLEKVPDDLRASYMSGLLYFFAGDVKSIRRLSANISKYHPEQPESALLMGLSYYLEKDYKDAYSHLQIAVSKKPTLTSVYYLGLTHFSLGDFELALTQFQRCLDITPTASHPRIMLAMTFMKQRRYKDAEVAAKRILDSDSVNAVAYNLLGSALLAQGHYDKGMEALSWATQFDPQLADAHYKKGIYSLNEVGKADEAEGELLTALELAPDVMNTRLVLAIQYMRRKDFPKALDMLQEGLNGTKDDAILHTLMAQAYFQLEKLEAGINELRKAKSIRPGLIAPYYTLAAYYISKGDYKLALEEYETLLTIVPDNLKALASAGQILQLLGDTQKAGEYLKRAAYEGVRNEYRAYLTFLIKQGEPENALKVLGDIVKKNPSSTSKLEDLGRLQLAQNKQTGALATFRKLAALAPRLGAKHTVSTLLQMGENIKARKVAQDVIDKNAEDSLGYLLVARVHQAGGDETQALQVLDGALGKVKDNGPVRMSLSIVYESMNNLTKARESLQALLDEQPRHVPGLFALASLENRNGEYGNAEALYKAVLELNPKHAYALNDLAYLYADNYDNIDGASPLAIRAYRIDPTNPSIVETLGFVLYKQGKFEKAERLLEEVKKVMPENPTLNYHLALVYNESAKAGQAAVLLRAALEMGDFPERSRAEKLLTSISN